MTDDLMKEAGDSWLGLRFSRSSSSACSCVCVCVSTCVHAYMCEAACV